MVVRRAFGFSEHLIKRRFFESGDAQYLENCVEAGLQIEAFFRDGDEHVDRDGDPDLGFDGVLGGAEDAFDAQVLLDPFEEGFDLPAAFVGLGDGDGGQGESVGQKDESLAGFGAAVCDAAQFIRIVGCGMDAPGAAWRQLRPAPGTASSESAGSARGSPAPSCR